MSTGRNSSGSSGGGAGKGGGSFGGHGDAALQYIKGTPEIIFAIATGTLHLADRAAGVIETWCSKINACVFFSDGGNSSGHPAVVPLAVEGADRNADGYVLAQMRYLPILEIMRTWLSENKLGLFSACKWVVLVDDDTYVLYHNLKKVLAKLDHTKPIYTGETIPDHWLPTHWTKRDGSGHVISVSANTSFVMGGGGSILSAVGLLQMTQLHQCVVNQLPGEKWYLWQSDWMIGLCAHEAGIGATHMPRGLFNQFVCTDEDAHVHYCPEQGFNVDGELTEPATIHPVKTIEAMRLLREDYPLADTIPTRNVNVMVGGEGIRVLRRLY